MNRGRPLPALIPPGHFTDWHPLHLPWPSQSGPCPSAPQVRWKHQEKTFSWEMWCPLPEAARDCFARSGFLEGLWNHDVAECFLLDQSTGHYTEYNLGPGGAWWAAHFISPRVQTNPQPNPGEFGVKASTAWSNHGWTGRMEITLPPLASPALNFTAIVQTAPCRHFFSLAPLSGERPDFHRPQEWIRLPPGG